MNASSSPISKRVVEPERKATTMATPRLDIKRTAEQIIKVSTICGSISENETGVSAPCFICIYAIPFFLASNESSMLLEILWLRRSDGKAISMRRRSPKYAEGNGYGSANSARTMESGKSGMAVGSAWSKARFQGTWL